MSQTGATGTLFNDVMSDRTFGLFSDFIHATLGIRMPPAKKTMLQSRLIKRMRSLQISSYDAYYDFVFSEEGRKAELANLMDIVTTNKTDFFREPRHFDYLVERALPWLMQYRRHTRDIGRKYNIWSSACSTGEEPYTLAMVLSEFAQHNPGFDFSVLATDISGKVLNHGIQAIYDEDRVEPVPMALKKKYLLRSRDRKQSTVRIAPELRKWVTFRQLNLMHDHFGINDCMDVIFCRNVIIYFDKQTQEGVLNRLCRHLRPNGYVFMGHSETLNGLNVPLTQEAPTIYRKIA